MMRAYIRKLQSKEEGTRKQILIASLVISMAVVGSVWVYSLNDRFTDTKTADGTTEEQQTTKPFALFSHSLSEAYKNIAASVGNVSFSKKEVPEEPKQIDLIVVEHPLQ